MSHKSIGLKALGLALMAALTSMAFIASTAQAHPEFYFKNAGGVFTLAGLNLVSGLSEGNTVATGGSELLVATGVKIFCKHQKGHGYIKNNPLIASPHLPAQGAFHAKVEFKKCEVLNNSVCKLLEPIVVDAKGVLILHASEPYALFEPLTGTDFVILHFIPAEAGEECNLPLNVLIGGKTAAEALLAAAVKTQLHFNDAVDKLICRGTVVPDLAVCGGGLVFGTVAASLDSLPLLELLNGNVGEGFEQNAGREWLAK